MVKPAATCRVAAVDAIETPAGLNNLGHMGLSISSYNLFKYLAGVDKFVQVSAEPAVGLVCRVQLVPIPKMDTNAHTCNTGKGSRAAGNIHSGQLCTDEDLQKQGVDQIENITVANVNLVSLLLAVATLLHVRSMLIFSQAAALGPNKPATWGSGSIKLYAMCALLYLCSTMNGYDGSLMGSINAIPEYTKFYGLSENGAASTGIIFSIFQIGQMIGALFIWVADWRGRRLSIFIGTAGVVVGTVVTSTAQTIPVFIGGSHSFMPSV